MTNQNYHRFAGTIFLIVGLVHLWRVVNGYVVAVGPYIVPMWLSWVVILLAGHLAFQGLRRK